MGPFLWGNLTLQDYKLTLQVDPKDCNLAIGGGQG